ncbi:hypothetical protein ZWY2020_006241 [Hordeum vulgare]|nr:hypothetical protein ZWY2020_006241 [Hordeum vulgare]
MVDGYTIAAITKTSRRMPLRDGGTLKGDGGVHALPVSLLRGRREVAPVTVRGAARDVVPGSGDGSPRRLSLEAPVAWSDGSTSGATSSSSTCSTKIPRFMTCLPPVARGNCASYAYHKRCSSPDPGHHRQPEQRLHKYIEMETDLQRRPEVVTSEEECFHQKPHPQPSFDGSRATTWIMPIPILSWEDWSPSCTIDADETIVHPMHHKLPPTCEVSRQ